MDNVKFGYLRGGMTGLMKGITGSEVFKRLSGHFVKLTSSYATKCGDGDSEILGWAQTHEQTVGSSNGDDELLIITDLTAVFRIPLRYESSTYTTNYTSTMRGKTCDLVVISNFQYANVTTSDDDLVIIVDGQAASGKGVGDGYVDVMINPNKVCQTGV